MKTRFQFEMLSGPTPGMIFPIEGDHVIVGRDTSANIVINDIEVSRKHFQLIWSAPGYLLEDLGSTNGIIIDEEKISSPQGLHGGEKLTLGGNIVLLFNVIPGEEQETVLSKEEPSASVTVESNEDGSSFDLREDLIDSNDSEDKEVDSHKIYDPSGDSLKKESASESKNSKNKRKRILLITLIIILIIACILGILYLFYAPVDFWCSNFSFYFKPELYPQCSP